VLIFDAESNEGLDTILRRLSLWGLAKWKITPLENLEGWASRDHHSLSNWSRVCRDKKHLVRSRTGPPEFSSRETCCHTSRKLGASRRLGMSKVQKLGFKIIRISVSAMAPARSTHCATSTQYPRACSIRETTGSVYNTSQESDMASNGKGVDVRGEVVNLLVEKIASDRNRSVTMVPGRRGRGGVVNRGRGRRAARYGGGDRGGPGPAPVQP
jgi:hypothetical protein